MNPTASPFDSLRVVALTLLRAFAGLLMMQHGAQKLFGWLGGVDGAGATPPLVSLFGLAGILEFFFAALVVVGLFTRPLALILAAEMAVAYFMAHAPQGFWPILNKGELAMLNFFVFLYFAAAGPGPISLDALRSKPRAVG